MTILAGVDGCSFGWLCIIKDLDINDAFAVLWTAERIYRKKAVSIPTEIEIDSVGLRMGFGISCQKTNIP